VLVVFFFGRYIDETIPQKNIDEMINN